ncbi:MAG: glycosylase [Lentisphaeria bacterium]|nr:glycosylase [Lentisphaeria bacterium]
MSSNAVPQWVKNAVFYEIYPQSFCDTNGDGIGDIPGIISKLDYIKSLGSDAVWLNPCFESPFQDAGYDVADFYKVAPRYGSNDDLKKLFAEAHKRGMKVVLDLVAGHTSMEHPFFKASASKEKTPYDNYFVWTRGWNEDTGNYRFISGLAERDGYFMINFFACQPALNYGFCPAEYPWQLDMDHPDAVAVQNELQNVMKFYLDMGCDGFRVDMASSLIKGSNAEHGIKLLWKRYRSWLDENYPQAVLIAEWCRPAKAIPAGFHIDFKAHFGEPGYSMLTRAEKELISNGGLPDGLVSFFHESGKGDAKTFLDELSAEYNVIKNDGLFGIVSGNHDMGRLRGNGRSDEMMKMMYAFLFSLPGVPFLYYGDEIGMDNILGLGNKEGSYNRSAARTPMQWDATEKAGFSTADVESFYLPVDGSKDKYNVASQENDSSSLLNFVRSFFSLKRSCKLLSNDAGFRVLYCESNRVPAIFERSIGDEKLIVAVNPSNTDCHADIEIDADGFEVILEQGKSSFSGNRISLGACSFALWKK